MSIPLSFLARDEKMISDKERDLNHNEGCIYKRRDAESILASKTKRSLFIDPLSLPIAGLRSISTDSSYPTLDSVPHEVLPFEYRPVVLCDLDEVTWSHIYGSVVRAVGEATGKQITRERYRVIGNTRCIPEWKDNPEIMAIHDQIVRGEHPEYYPYVNVADPKAIIALHAIERMGHTFAYLTSRPQQVLKDTLRVIEWNRMPVDANQRDFVDAFDHEEPKNGYVYGGKEMPMVVGRKRIHKREVAYHWLKNLQKNGWKGHMVLIDDLLEPFKDLLEERKIVGIALRGDVNASLQAIKGEMRVDSWSDISEILMDVHKRAVASNNSPYRIFEHLGRKHFVNKSEAGFGVFCLRTIPENAWRWEDSAPSVDIQEEFKQISRS